MCFALSSNHQEQSKLDWEGPSPIQDLKFQDVFFLGQKISFDSQILKFEITIEAQILKTSEEKKGVREKMNPRRRIGFLRNVGRVVKQQKGDR